MLNELIINSAKYARPAEGSVSLDIDAKRTAGGMLLLQVKDNGRSSPRGFLTAGRRLGARLVTSLVGQLQGTIEQVEDEGAASFAITIPVPPGVSVNLGGL